MALYKVTKKAQADLMEIGIYTINEWGATQRNAYLKQLDDCFTQLAENPLLGVQVDFIAKGYRKFPQGSHLIFYKQDMDGVVEIIRILHKTMDLESKL